ncbi:MAG: hypothetical protein A3I78_06420 [Gammaproteobacteria bacterium RIFCSPLOWO2_02_FULL_56_15]|nr:MAG: hypothetical protein A3I78_06420 [Gammaproteobacteria bacterium RIFCSPLOWO2_02_FULL_56_15]
MTTFRQAAAGSGRSVCNVPAPGREAIAHSEALTHRIIERIIENKGAIGFDQFMRMALYEPGLGYYSAGARKFGRDGDFVTAPEISPLFSRCIAVQCEEVLRSIGGGSLLEVGAGTGAMAAEMLRELEYRNCLPERYLILEISADLKARQQELLTMSIPHLMGRIEWLAGLPKYEFRGVIVANEVLDAQPVVRLGFEREGIFEYCVSRERDDFTWSKVTAGPEIISHAGRIRRQLDGAWPNGYTTEINLGLDAWVSTFAGILEQGVILLVDYGYPRHEYYHWQRDQGTLLCHYRHRVHHDPFLYPGLQDITTSVDFTAVAEAAIDAGLSLIGYTNQAYFLLSCDMEQIMNRLADMDQKHRMQLLAQIRMLTMPGEMGERFKLMVLGRKCPHQLRGFTRSDQRGHL